MTKLRALAVTLLAVLATDTGAGAAPPTATFSGFVYDGADPADRVPLPPGHYRNPILAGFRPDPAITRVGRNYYLVTSSFAWWPGLPIFHSRDLVHWRQIGAAITRPGRMSLAGRFTSDGLYGPDLKYHAGRFYVLGTCFRCGGNFIVTARHPRGPWSDPHWLPFEGIDPSIVFDIDGRAYLVNNGPPVGEPRWSGHRALWLQQIDLATLTMTGPRTVIVDSGADPATRPEWIEGPHIFRRGGFYYLIAAEGGTGTGHSEVVFRATAIGGPWVAGPANPILTQRDLPPDRPDAIAATGHADFTTTPDGRWWSVFLGVRPYAGDLYNTGRDSFLLPVGWRDGWPVILGRGAAVPRIVRGPALPRSAAPASAGRFAIVDSFRAPGLARHWALLRTPVRRWWSAGGGTLRLQARGEPLGGLGQPSFVAIRQAHAHASATVTLRALDGACGATAGLAAFADERRWYAVAVAGGEIRLLARLDGAEPPAGRVVATAPLGKPLPLRLRIAVDGGAYRFLYAHPRGPWRQLGGAQDGTPLTTARAGGFTGTMIGPFAACAAEPGAPA